MGEYSNQVTHFEHFSRVICKLKYLFS